MSAALRSPVATMFYCFGCCRFRDNPAATATTKAGEWQRLIHAAEDRPCSDECRVMLGRGPAAGGG